MLKVHSGRDRNCTFSFGCPSCQLASNLKSGNGAFKHTLRRTSRDHIDEQPTPSIKINQGRGTALVSFQADRNRFQAGRLHVA
jgi:hypothetical protein